MKARVTYNDDGEVTGIKIKAGRNEVGYAVMDGTTAVITTVYPWEGCDGVSGDEIQEQVEFLESLPFVQAATVGGCDE